MEEDFSYNDELKNSIESANHKISKEKLFKVFKSPKSQESQASSSNNVQPINRKLDKKIKSQYGGNPSLLWRQDIISISQNVSHEMISLKDLPKNAKDFDPRFGDKNFVCFRFRKLEFFCRVQKFISHSNYFNRIYSLMQSEFEAKLHKKQLVDNDLCQILVHLPDDTKASAVVLLLNTLEQCEDEFQIDDMNLFTANELIIVAERLKMRQLVKKLLQCVIFQQINRDNVLYYVGMSYYMVKIKGALYREEVAGNYSDSEEDKSEEEDENDDSKNSDTMSDVCIDDDDSITSIKKEESDWLDFFYYCIDLTAVNILYIAQFKWEELIKNFPEQVLSEVINKAIQFNKSDPNYDNKPIINLLLKVRKCTSVFTLLQLERERIIKEESEFRQQVKREPLLTWSVRNINNCFYKQSDTIQLLDAQWRLALSYFKTQNTGLKVEIKLLNNPYDIKQNKTYFKKQDFEVPSNLDAERIDPIAQFEVQNEDDEDRKAKMQQLNAHASDYPSHCFVSFLSSVHFDFDKIQSEAEVYTLICSAKAPTELRRVKDFSFDPKVDPDILDVGIFFQMQELHAQIISYISKNFTYLINDPDIKYLRREEFKVLLKHKYLNVTQEDDVIKAICLWVEGQSSCKHEKKMINSTTISNQQKQNAGETLIEIKLQDAISDLLQQVNWDYVSLPCFLDVIRNHVSIRSNQTFKTQILKQFTERYERSDPFKVSQDQGADGEDESDEAERNKTRSQSQPRFSYKFNKSQKQLYPTSAELQRQGGGIISAVPEQIRQFQMLYPVQIYPDFFKHLIDCMLNPVNMISNHQALHNAAIQGDPFMSKSIQKKHLLHQIKKKRGELKFLQNQLQALETTDLILATQGDWQDQFRQIRISSDPQHSQVDEGFSFFQNQQPRSQSESPAVKHSPPSGFKPQIQKSEQLNQSKEIKTFDAIMEGKEVYLLDSVRAKIQNYQASSLVQSQDEQEIIDEFGVRDNRPILNNQAEKIDGCLSNKVKQEDGISLKKKDSRKEFVKSFSVEVEKKENDLLYQVEQDKIRNSPREQEKKELQELGQNIMYISQTQHLNMSMNQDSSNKSSSQHYLLNINNPERKSFRSFGFNRESLAFEIKQTKQVVSIETQTDLTLQDLSQFNFRQAQLVSDNRQKLSSEYKNEELYQMSWNIEIQSQNSHLSQFSLEKNFHLLIQSSNSSPESLKSENDKKFSFTDQKQNDSLLLFFKGNAEHSHLQKSSHQTINEVKSVAHRSLSNFLSDKESDDIKKKLQKADSFKSKFKNSSSEQDLSSRNSELETVTLQSNSNELCPKADLDTQTDFLSLLIPIENVDAETQKDVQLQLKPVDNCNAETQTNFTPESKPDLAVQTKIISLEIVPKTKKPSISFQDYNYDCSEVEIAPLQSSQSNGSQQSKRNSQNKAPTSKTLTSKLKPVPYRINGINSTKNIMNQKKFALVDDYSQKQDYDNFLVQFFSQTKIKPKLKHMKLLSQSPHSAGSISTQKQVTKPKSSSRNSKFILKSNLKSQKSQEKTKSISKDSIQKNESQSNFRSEMQQAQMLEEDSGALLKKFRLQRMNKIVPEEQTDESKQAKLMKLRQFTVNALQKQKQKLVNSPEKEKFNFRKQNSQSRSKSGRTYQKEITISVPSFYQQLQSDRAKDFNSDLGKVQFNVDSNQAQESTKLGKLQLNELCSMLSPLNQIQTQNTRHISLVPTSNHQVQAIGQFFDNRHQSNQSSAAHNRNGQQQCTQTNVLSPDQGAVHLSVSSYQNSANNSNVSKVQGPNRFQTQKSQSLNLKMPQHKN